MFVNFTEEARKILMLAKKEMYELKHSYIGTEHVLLAIMHTKNSISKKLEYLGLSYEELKQEIIETIGYGNNEQDLFIYTPLLKRVIEAAILNAKENNLEVTIEDIFFNILEEGDGIAYRILLELNIDLDSIIEIPINKNKGKKNKKLILEELGLDLTKKAQNNELDPAIGRDQELTRIIEILSRRTKNNPILIGKAGVGKTAIIEELARRIVSGDVPNCLKNKRIFSLDMASSVAGTKYRGEFEERVRKIIKEVEDNNDIILFIDEIHTLVGAGGAEGAIDASNIFKPSLARNKFRVIGATTLEEYKKFIEKDRALDRRFQKVLIEVPNRESTIGILKEIKEIYANYHQVSISDEIITSIVDLTDKYIFDRNQPDKAIDVLDEVCAMVNIKESKELKEYNELSKKLNNIIADKKKAILNKDYELASTLKEKENQLLDELNQLELMAIKKPLKEVTLNDVANVISAKTNTPIYEIMADNAKIISNIEHQLKHKVIGQEQALNEVIKLSKRLKLGYKDDSKCYSMLFLGPTGVGKTLLATLFGKAISDNIIRLDMSEYSEAHAVSKIIGSPPGYVGYEDAHNIFEEVREKNSGVIILDEIEKAHPAVINLFLQILDQSSIKDSLGHVIHFDNYILIMTSNIGYENSKVGFNQENTNSELKEYFSKSFINRIDNIIRFNYLDESAIDKIVGGKLELLKQKYLKKGIKIKYNSRIKKEIINNSNYKEFGARKIDKYIKDKIETKLIDEIIDNKGEMYELSTT
ncbi:MAG: ATP-dependent Clp protease ATP-binding subunit [Bacilli bacterium]|nr:ATP-dependent Clp protease ATP-binding subunit [Bacilli bacterium]